MYYSFACLFVYRIWLIVHVHVLTSFTWINKLLYCIVLSPPGFNAGLFIVSRFSQTGNFMFALPTLVYKDAPTRAISCLRW